MKTPATEFKEGAEEDLKKEDLIIFIIPDGGQWKTGDTGLGFFSSEESPRNHKFSS